MEKRLRHRDEADQFYGSLGAPVRVGMEARGHELWLGDAAKIRAGVVRKQKTDRRDAEQILRLLIEDRFPKIWTPSLAERDARQLLVHRHKQVVRRTQVKPIASDGARSRVQKKWKLWTEAGRAQLEQIELLPYAAERRRHLLQTLDQLQVEIEGLNQRVEAEARQRLQAVKLMTHPGVGPVTALALVLTLGPAERFHSPKQVGQLLRADSQRALQRRAPAAGAHYQAGQFVFALPAGGGGPVGCTVRF